MRFMICLLFLATMMMAGGCQQKQMVQEPVKEINLLGDLQTRSAQTSYTSATTTIEAGGVIVNTLGMRMVPVQAATFTMGSPMSEGGRQEDEHQHPVRISRRYHISSTEVTQAQWLKVMRTEPWRGMKNVAMGRDQPATHMTHDEAVQFCLLMSRIENATYRLPTEAEWELAARGGSDQAYGISGELNDHAWTDANSMKNHAATVGTRKASEAGVFDMHGNVAEWCSDWYGPYPRSLVTDPTGPATGDYRIVRGGAWDSSPRFCRSAYRTGTEPQTRSASIGLRVVLVK